MVKTRQSPVEAKPADMSFITENGSFDTRFEAALKKLIQSVIREELGDKLTKLNEVIASLEVINTRPKDLEESMSFTAQRLDNVVKTMITAITDHMAQLTEGLVRQTLPIDVHRMKWNVVLHRLDGEIGEEETWYACAGLYTLVYIALYLLPNLHGFLT